MCQILARLLGQGSDEVGMGVAEPVHRDAGAEVEVSLAALRHEPGALAALEGERRTGVGRQKG